MSNVFRRNQQYTGAAAAIAGNGSSPLISHNLFLDNSGIDTDLFGGVVDFFNDSLPLLINNVFVSNPCVAIHISLPAGGSAMVSQPPTPVAEPRSVMPKTYSTS